MPWFKTLSAACQKLVARVHQARNIYATPGNRKYKSYIVIFPIFIFCSIESSEYSITKLKIILRKYNFAYQGQQGTILLVKVKTNATVAYLGGFSDAQPPPQAPPQRKGHPLGPTAPRSSYLRRSALCPPFQNPKYATASSRSWLIRSRS